MTLNATLLVQIVNFLIAWGIIRYIFIGPALKLRDALACAYATLTTERDDLQMMIEQVRDQEYSAWRLWTLQTQKIMRERYRPQLQHEPLTFRVPTPEVPTDELERVAIELTELVHKRIQELP